MEAIIVTGASGFIGRRLATRLCTDRPDARVRCLVKEEEDPFAENGVEFLVSRLIHPIRADLVRGTGLAKLPKPELLFHLAANTHTWEPDQRCNDFGTENLLRALGTLGPANHVVLTSTTAVMDNRDNLDTPLEPLPMIEKQPLSRYGQSKLRAEQFLRAESVKQGFPLSIVRLCTVYGPQPRPNTLLDVLKREVARKTLASRLNWPGLTSFIHVNDVVRCLMEIGDKQPQPGETRTYLLATESKTLADVSRLLYRAQRLVYQSVCLPKTAWNLFRSSHWLCRWGATWLPARLHNALWRFNAVANSVFHCDTSLTAKWFPDLKPTLMADCIHEI